MAFVLFIVLSASCSRPSADEAASSTDAAAPIDDASDQRAPRREEFLLHVWDFETGEAGQWTDYKLPGEQSLGIVTSPVRAGRFAARFMLQRDDPPISDGKRAELQIDGVGEIGSGEDIWYGFSTFLPPDWEEDRQYEILAQWKGKRDKDLGEASKSPALAFRVRRDEWYITNRFDPRPITPDNSAPQKTLWRGEYGRAVWTDWVVHARWSFRDDGLLEIWKDGEKIVEQHGPNTYNDQRGMYFKIGIYKAPWGKPVKSDVDRRTVVHDEIRIAGPGAAYEDVAP